MWIGFIALVVALLALDLGVFHRKAHEVRLREAAAWSVVWVTLALVFGLGVHRVMGPEAGLQFLTGYLVEKALSVDNIFVFVLVFSYFRVPAAYHHRILFWGIVGALVMRGAMILAGAALLERFHWLIYVFGAFLVFTGARMATEKERHVDPEANPVIRLLRRLVPITPGYRGQRLLVRESVVPGGASRWAATPLLVVLLVVETTDVVFAVDSIPAIFAITTDPFLVFTSNVFAILGLRAMYFLLAGVIQRFRFLQLGLAAVLVFVGAKMLAADVVAVPVAVSLGVVAAILATSIVASLAFPLRQPPERVLPGGGPPAPGVRGPVARATAGTSPPR
jgi:tellurite resistance protein TerC